MLFYVAWMQNLCFHLQHFKKNQRLRLGRSIYCLAQLSNTIQKLNLFWFGQVYSLVALPDSPSPPLHLTLFRKVTQTYYQRIWTAPDIFTILFICLPCWNIPLRNSHTFPTSIFPYLNEGVTPTFCKFKSHNSPLLQVPWLGHECCAQ